MTAATWIQRLNLQRFWRGEGPESGPITLDRKRIFVLPTDHGLRFALILLVMLLGSMNYSNSLGFGLTFLLAGIGVVAILHAYFNMAELSFHAGRTEAVFLGQQAHFSLRISNPRSHQRRALMITAIEEQQSQLIDLPPGQTTIPLARTSKRRGRLPLGRVRIETRFPLGLVRAWSYLDLTMSTLVYPRPAKDAPPLPLQASQPHASSDGRAGDEDFAGLRPYHAGDTLRQIHWKVSTRSETLQVKQYAGSGGNELLLDWDLTPGFDTEQRLSILCRWVLDAERSGQPYSLRLPGVELGMSRGTLHRDHCLEALACFGVS